MEDMASEQFVASHLGLSSTYDTLQEWANELLANIEETTLKDILRVMALNDEGEIELSEDNMKALAARVKEKADGYQSVHEEMAATEARLKIRIDTWRKEMARVTQDRENLEKILLWNMQQNKIEMLPGNDYIVKRRKSPPKLVTKVEASSQMKVKYPGLVRVKYEWEANKIKKALKTAPEDDALWKLFDITQAEKPKFEVNKGKLYE